MLPSLRPLFFGACLLLLCGQDVEAQAWRERQFAGYSAFDSGDLAGAVEHLEAALAGASQDPADARERGAILEHLATAYHAVGRQKDAWAMLGAWDRVLEQHASEAWASNQRAFRSLLVQFMIEHPGESGGDAGLQNDGPPPATTATAATTTSPATITSPATAAAATPGDYAIHLASLGAGNDVESSWHRLSAAYPSQLTGRTLVVKQVDLGDQGNFSRILAAPFSDLADAELACSELQALGQYCTALPLN